MPDKRTPEELAGKPLTGGEKRILLLATRFDTAEEIANHICRSKRTVEFHLNNAMRKLEVHSTCRAVVEAVRKGFIEL